MTFAIIVRRIAGASFLQSSVFLRDEREENMSQTPRSITELFCQYLRRQIAAQAERLGWADPDGQVVPHEAVPMQPVDPQLAWDDALAVLRWSRAGETPVPSGHWEAPPDWPALVAALEPARAVAFCIGNFPQMVRNLQPLLERAESGIARERAGSESDGLLHVAYTSGSSILQWANKAQDYPQLLIAAGVLRLGRRFKEASQLLRANGETPAAWQALRANEEAALAWHRGNAEEALALWHTQKPSVPVLFNRGMAALFLDRPAEARVALEQAVAQLPDTSAWHHLGHLYLALSAARP
jgi:tetratricopeptide (TPR) repeat protein